MWTHSFSFEREKKRQENKMQKENGIEIYRCLYNQNGEKYIYNTDYFWENEIYNWNSFRSSSHR